MRPAVKMCVWLGPPDAYQRSGTTGCEILFNGTIVVWTVDETWAALLTQLLNHNPLAVVGLSGVHSGHERV